MNKKKGYILLTDTGTLLTKLIKLFTKKPYNHVSIAFDSDLSDIYSFGRKTAGNPFIGGFVQEDTKSGLFKQATCAIYSFEVTEIQWQKMNRYIQNMEKEKEHYRYNFLGLFGFIVNKPINRKKAFFCSQFVASVLKDANVIDFKKSLSLIAPNDLLEVPSLQLEFEGRLKDYHNENTDDVVCVPFHFIPVEM